MSEPVTARYSQHIGTGQWFMLLYDADNQIVAHRDAPHPYKIQASSKWGRESFQDGPVACAWARRQMWQHEARFSVLSGPVGLITLLLESVADAEEYERTTKST